MFDNIDRYCNENVGAILVHCGLFGNGSPCSCSHPGSPTVPVQLFKSSPLQPFVTKVTKNGKTEPGYIFLSPIDVLKLHGFPAIYTDHGKLVWQGPTGNITGFKTQILNGEPVLTYWNGTASIGGFGYGSIHFLNQSYEDIHRVTLPDDNRNFKTALGPRFPSYIDLHEDAITNRGSVLVTAFNVTRADLTGVGGPKDGWIHNSQFYEIDIASNNVLFSWSTLDHLNMTETMTPVAGSGNNQSNPWEFAHLNSVMRNGDHYIVSSHGYCSVYAIDSKGNIQWTLNVCSVLSYTYSVSDGIYRAERAGTLNWVPMQHFAISTTSGLNRRRTIHIFSIARHSGHHRPSDRSGLRRKNSDSESTFMGCE